MDALDTQFKVFYLRDPWIDVCKLNMLAGWQGGLLDHLVIHKEKHKTVMILWFYHTNSTSSSTDSMQNKFLGPSVIQDIKNIYTHSLPLAITHKMPGARKFLLLHEGKLWVIEIGNNVWGDRD